MLRRIGIYCLELLGIALLMAFLVLINAVPDTRYIPLIVIVLMSLMEIGLKLSAVDRKLEALAKKLNVSLEDAPAREEKKIIVNE